MDVLSIPPYVVLGNRSGSRKRSVHAEGKLCMSKWLLIGFWVVCISVPVRGDGFSLGGWAAPLPVRNAEPLNILFLQAPPASASIRPENRTRLQLSLDVVNHLLFDRAGTSRFEQDFEMQRLTVACTRGIGHDAEIVVHVPLMARNGGVLDEVINIWHRWLRLGGGGRAKYRNYRIHGLLVLNGETIARLDTPAIGLGDMIVEWRKGLGRTGRSLWAARVMLKLPTGNAAQLFGSGAMDAGVGVICTYESSGRLAWHGNLSMVWLGKPSHLGAPARNTVQWMVALEYMPDERISLVLQVDDNRAPVLMGAPYADGARRSFTVGVVRQVRRGLRIYLSVTQNQFGWLARIAPDLHLHSGIQWDW